MSKDTLRAHFDARAPQADDFAFIQRVHASREGGGTAGPGNG